MARKSRYSEHSSSIDTQQEKRNLAGLYTRLSVEDGDSTEQNSIESQKKIAMDFLKDRADIQLVNVYMDNGFSGMNFNRPDFNRMLHDIKRGAINCVIVKDISRLGRNFLMTSEYVEKVFPQMGVRLLCINDGFDSSAQDADTSQLLLPFKMVMNDAYVRDISKKIRSSINVKMQQGEYLPPSGSVPYGYLRNPDEHRFDIDQETCGIVRRIYDMRATGMSYTGIARILNGECVPSPGKLRFLRGLTSRSSYENVQWERKTVRKICNDSVYIGNRIHGRVKRKRLNDVKKRTDESEWLVIPDAHDPIIDQELFDKVQMVNRAKEKAEAEKKKRAPVAVDYRELFRGKIICGDCKQIMAAAKGCARQGEKKRISSGEKRYSRIFYDCTTYRNTFREKCSSHYIRQETIYNTVKTFIESQVSIVIDLEELYNELLMTPKVVGQRARLQTERMNVNRRRKVQEEKLQQLLYDLTEGLIDRGVYDYEKKRFLEELENIKRQGSELALTIAKFEDTIRGAGKWIETMKAYQKSPEISKELVNELIDSIEVYGNKEIKIHLRYGDPFQSLVNYVEQIPEVIS